MTPKSVGVTTVTMFQCTDGQQYPSQKEAEQHQLGVNRRKAIRDKIKVLVPHGRLGTAERIEDLTTFLYHHIEELQTLIDEMREAGLLGHHTRESDQ